MTATPWGFRDILPEEAQAREEIACTVKGCFREHHYLPVETPLLEDKGSLEEGGRIADTPFKLFDDDGRLLVVRPDNTLPIVRLVSTRMRAADLPLRLRYEAPVARVSLRSWALSLSARVMPRAMSRLFRWWRRPYAGWHFPMRALSQVACVLLRNCSRYARIASWLPRPCAACMPTTLWASMPAWLQAPSPMP